MVSRSPGSVTTTPFGVSGRDTRQGVHLYLHQQGVDTTTPAGKALFQMTGVFAEFERAVIQERVRAGLERAKAQGKGMLRIAREVGCGTGTVQRVVKLLD